MNKLLKVISGMGLLLASSHSGIFAASTDQVAITIRTDIYNISGADNNFAIHIGLTTPGVVAIDGGYGPTEFNVDIAAYDPETQDIKASVINTPVTSDGYVTISCDPLLIDYLDMEGEYIRTIDMPEVTNLEILNMDHNCLESLDLTPFTKLQSISLTDNEFGVTPLIVGGNKPDLVILTLDIIEHMSEDFNLSDYPSLQVFSAWNNRGLKKLDPTGCPNLVRLSIDATDVEHLDLSNNKKLRILNIGDSRVTDFDLSILPELQEFYCTHQSGTINPDVKLTSLDVTKNPNLVYLYCAGNKLTSLDLTHNPKLQMLNVCHNELTGLDLSSNPDLVEVNISYNNMDFATMPCDPGTWSDFITHQNPMKVDYSYPVGAAVDLSSRVITEGSPTYATLLLPDPADPNNVVELGEEYFSYENGVVTLKKELSDSVRIEFYNPLFPDASLATSAFVVKSAEEYGQPSAIVTWSGDYNTDRTVALHIGVSGASETNPATVYVDFGDGVQKEYTVNTDNLPSEPNITGTAAGSGLMSLLVPDGVFVSSFGMHHPLYSFNSSNMTTVTSLDLSGCGLYDIDLLFNYRLEHLDLSDNKLYSINLDGPYAGLNKLRLGDIKIARNNLTEFEISDNRTLVSLDLSGNKIEKMSFRDADNVRSLNLSGNLLNYIDLTYCALLENLDLSDNRLESVAFPEFSPEKIDLSGNKLTFTSLPQPASFSGADYIYSPQSEIAVPAKGFCVNLSSQDVDYDGNKTSYSWYRSDGTALEEGSDYTIDGGRTTFLKGDLGKIYCEMNNGAFPTLTLRTTAIESAEAPTNVVATFTTPAGGEKVELSLAAVSGAPAVYIDWSGKGDLEQYALKDTYTRFSATTVAGAKVTVYSYSDDSPLSVFSMSNATIEDFEGYDLVSLICLTISNAGLSDIKLPDAPALEELNLDKNNFSTIDITKYPNLRSIDLSNNKLETFDLSPFKSLQTASLGVNNLTSLILGNPLLWGLSLNENELSAVDFAKAPSIEQLSLSGNRFETIDVTVMPRLAAINLDRNRFNFATLPIRKNNWLVYNYRGQDAIAATAEGNTVDLSFNKAAADETETEYTWYVGMPYFDENGEIIGEVFGSENYTIENGVTDFISGSSELVCLMSNDAFEGLYMYTLPIDIEGSGIETVDASDIIVAVADGTVTVRSAKEMTVSLYGINGVRIASQPLNGGETTFTGLQTGIYILSTPAGAYRLAVK